MGYVVGNGSKCMKKAILFLATAFISFFATGFSGCGEDDISMETAEKSDLQIAREVSQVIIDAFINKDEEALYSILAQEMQEFELTKDQIKAALELIDGEIVSYELPTDTGGGGERTEGGKTVSKNMTPWIYFYTDSGNIYRISFQYFLIFENSEENGTGICRMIVSLLDENKSLVKRVGIGFNLDENSIQVVK